MPKGREYYGKGYGEFANMPRDVVDVEFPRAEEGLNVDLDDTSAGIDDAIGDQTRYLRGHIPDSKY
ncbi:MAG: hypothetical protein PVF17_00445 [Ignavibacteria bacterium]